MSECDRRITRRDRTIALVVASALLAGQAAAGDVVPHSRDVTNCSSLRTEIPLAPCVVSADTLFECSFEGGLADCGGWTASNGLWDAGAPCAPPAPHSGLWVAGALLCGNYPDGQSTRLSTVTPLALPSLAADERLLLRFWQWYRFNGGDTGTVEIRTFRGAAWGPWLAVRDGLPTQRWTSPVWSLAALDLSSYADSIVQIGFRFTSVNLNGGAPEVDRGWVLDDVSIVRESLEPIACQTTQSFEDGWSAWHADGGHWEVGVATSGPAAARSGTQLAGTNLAGNYTEDVVSRLVSPPIALPSVVTCGELRLRFWHWYRFNGGDGGQVQIRTRGNGSWGPWHNSRDGHPAFTWNSPSWTSPSIDLSSYADSTIQVGFQFWSTNLHGGAVEVDAGWFIDEISIVNGAVWSSLESPNTESFEHGLLDWAVDGGHWQVGDAVSEPGAARSGTAIASTRLGADYLESVSSRLVSPPIALGANALALQVCFWHWFRFNSGDLGALETRTWQAGSWGPWQAMIDRPGPFQGIGATWTRVCVGLPTYANQIVQVGFRFVSVNHNGGADDVDAGWSIDDVQIAGVVTDAADDAVRSPRAYLHPNVPNPFNPTTRIRFTMDRTASARLDVVDVAGRHVRTLFDGVAVAGDHACEWGGTDAAGRPAASGVYLYRLHVAGRSETRRMVLVR